MRTMTTHVFALLAAVSISSIVLVSAVTI